MGLGVRNVLLNQLSEIKEDKVALLLSGGNGSASVLFALLELGKKIHAYTFHMEGHESTDVKKARELTKKYNIEFTPVSIPTDIDTLKSDVLYLINEIGCNLKTDIECALPIKYTLSKVEENIITSGLGDDNFFGLSKKAQINYKHTIEGMNFYRAKSHSDYEVQIALFQKMANQYGIKFVSPYQSQEMIDLFMDTSYEQINKPKVKQWIIDAYPKELTENKFYHANYQKGDSKISDNFLQLLESDWNLNNYKSTVGIYNSVKRGEIVK